MGFKNTAQMHLQRRHDFVCFRTFLLLLWWIASSAATENTTHSPTLAPTCSHDHHHHHHHHHCNDTTDTPSLTPSRLYPTLAPTVPHNHTISPTAPDSNIKTLAPTPAVVTSPPTAAPSAEPPKTESPTTTPATTTAPTASPAPPAPVPPPRRKVSIWRILGKTLGWLILIALSVLLFGAIMSNRYQIYYFFVATGRRIRRLECTRWILQKTGLYRFFGDDGSGGGAALNEVIFDRSDLTEGLLMTGEDQS